MAAQNSSSSPCTLLRDFAQFRESFLKLRLLKVFVNFPFEPKKLFTSCGWVGFFDP